MPEFRKMRRLSVYFRGSEGITLVLEPEDTLKISPKTITITGPLGTGGSFVRTIEREAVAHTNLVTYQLEVTEPPKADPEKIEPDDELR